MEPGGNYGEEKDIKLTKLARCAGCGAKVGAGVLEKLLTGISVLRDPDLLVGFDTSDDASVYRISEELALVQTVDFFPPIHDDPYIFGQIAAANALSDIYAMGGEPRLALNIMAVPEKMPQDAVHEILRGGYEKAYEAGVIISGGHSILDDEPIYGLAVTGFADPRRVIRNSTAREGDILILTKPLGTGILTTAAKADLTGPETMKRAVGLMTVLNKAARDIMVRHKVNACTDVTGFSLLGHCLEMAQGSGTELHIDTAAVDIIPEALELARLGILPEGMYRNRDFAEAFVDPGDVSLCIQDVLYDPQTSGGLLMAVDPADADALFSELKGAVPSAQRIGRVERYRGGKRLFLASADLRSKTSD
ncbi:MAG TPA: selenide, water dikinase SelD [Lachnospiraceae bacterium]|nr:selenide, water dikinase SelD [Lachnospiraceae bacterium]